MLDGKNMHLSKQYFSNRGDRKIHDVPFIQEWQRSIQAYTKDTNPDHILRLYWDTVLISDYNVFMDRSLRIIDYLESMFRDDILHDDLYILGFYLRLNENIDFRSNTLGKHNERYKARQRNWFVLYKRDGEKESLDSLYERYKSLQAAVERDWKLWKKMSGHCYAAVDCLNSMQRYPIKSWTWYWYNLYDTISLAALYESYTVCPEDRRFLYLKIRYGLYSEKAKILKNKQVQFDESTKTAIESRKQQIAIDWIIIYSQILNSRKMPSGINKRVYDAMFEMAKNASSLNRDYRILVNDSMYNMKKNLGYYNAGVFDDSYVPSILIHDPIEYVKDIYLARGFVEQRSFFKKGIVMTYSDLKIGINKVINPTDVEKLATGNCSDDFIFYYFVYHGNISEELKQQFLLKINQIEIEKNCLGTFRFIYQIVPDLYGCDETFKNMI